MVEPHPRDEVKGFSLFAQRRPAAAPSRLRVQPVSKPKILLQLDCDQQPSVFDAVVAIDAEVDHLFRHGSVTPENVRDLVYGAIFTRGGSDLKNTAIFIGGADVAAGEALLAAVEKTFFGPRVSVMMDANGANTTAAAAALCAMRHVPAQEMHALVLGGTGPVGQRVARLLAGEGARVRLASRSAARAAQTCETIAAAVPGTKLEPWATDSSEATEAALEGVNVVIAAGAAGVELLSAASRERAEALKVAIDLNAVPPVGLEGVRPTDHATSASGVIVYGALGVGRLKMKIHKACIRQLFTGTEYVLDAEAILDVGRQQHAASS